MGPDAGGRSNGFLAEMLSAVQVVKITFRMNRTGMEVALLGQEVRGPAYSPEVPGYEEPGGSGVKWFGLESWLYSPPLCDLQKMT